MKLTELVERLQALHEQFGNQDIYIDTTPDGLLEIDDVDYNEEHDGIVIWAV